MTRLTQSIVKSLWLQTSKEIVFYNKDIINVFVVISISEEDPRLKMKDEDLEIMEIWP